MVDTIFILVSAACYPERIAPAAEQFSRSGETAGLVKLLREAQQRMHALPAAEKPSAFDQGFDQLQGHLDIIEGREFYRPSTNHHPPRPGARTSKADLTKGLCRGSSVLLIVQGTVRRLSIRSACGASPHSRTTPTLPL